MYSKEGMYMENNEDKLLDEQINKIINDDSSNNFSNNETNNNFRPFFIIISLLNKIYHKNFLKYRGI